YSLVGSYCSVAGSTANPTRIFGGPGFNIDIWKRDTLTGQTKNSGQSSPDQNNTDLRKLSSVLVVFTSDKTKWTRCVVLEMQEKSQLSEGHVFYFSPRNHASVDKNGNPATQGSGASDSPDAPNFISETGMGWFPGYAINIETGERLNVAFGED